MRVAKFDVISNEVRNLMVLQRKRFLLLVETTRHFI